MNLSERKRVMEDVERAEESLKRLRMILFPAPEAQGQYLHLEKFGTVSTPIGWNFCAQATEQACSIVATILSHPDVKALILAEAKRVYEEALKAEARMLEERHIEIPQDLVEMEAKQ